MSLQGFNRHGVAPLLSRPGDPPWAYATCPVPVDAAVATLPVGEDDVVVCAAGAGDVPLGWLAAGAGRVFALGSPAQLAMVGLKCAASARLRPIERRQIWGLAAAGRRVWLLHELTPDLTPVERSFWRANEGWVREGLDGAGRLERRLRPGWSLGDEGLLARALAWRRIQGAAGLVWPGARAPEGARARWFSPNAAMGSDPWSTRALRGAWGRAVPPWLRPDTKLGERVAAVIRVDLADAAAVAAALAQATVVDRTGLPVEVRAGVRWVRRSWGTNAAADGSPWGGGLELSP